MAIKDEYPEQWAEFETDLELALDEQAAIIIERFWAEVKEEDPPEPIFKATEADWRRVTDGFSKVMQIAHNALRLQDEDIPLIAGELTHGRLMEFNDAVSDYMGQIGVGGKADLRPGAEMDQIKRLSDTDAKSIVHTYNLDLARQIREIRKTTPHANRRTYVARIRAWEIARKAWKMVQIALHTTMTTRDLALKAFVRHNNLAPDVRLMPREAVEPICRGWVNRGLVSYAIAKRNPSPWHVGCVHYWQPTFKNGNGDVTWMG